MDQQTLLARLRQLEKDNARLQRIADDARAKLDAALDGTGLCLWQLDVPSGKLIIFNRRFGSLLGYEPKVKAAHFDVWRAHLHPDDKDEVLENFYAHLQGKTPFYEVLHRMVGNNGRITWVLDRGRVVAWDAKGEPLRVMGTHIDMTQEKDYEQQLQALAEHDPLTGTLNRRALEQQFYLRRQQGPFYLCFIDLDDFKTVNDQLGHRSGDELLMQLTHRLQALIDSDTALGRLGGDEFLLLLPRSSNSSAAETLAQQCIEAMQAPFSVDNGDAQVGLSIGIEQVRAGERFEQALARADAAMYRVKSAGKSGFYLPEGSA